MNARITFITLLFTVCFIPLYGQQAIQTKIITPKQPTSASFQPFRISRIQDTLLVPIAQGFTDSTGRLHATLQNGDYVLAMSIAGYKPLLQRFSSNTGKYPALPPTMELDIDKVVQLNGVTIVDNTPPVSMKGDTVEYNANKFKTRENAVVDELLRKLPGVQVEKDGTIKAQGETVQRILVDGKEFFGNDPAIASRNLPANMIDKVQVLDKQSDMAEFTGVNDGQQVKTINLVTKKNSKRGIFGNVHGGIGTNERYDAGINANSLLDDMQLSLLLKGNNVNKSGFSAAELIRLAGTNPTMFRNLPPAAISELMRMKGVRIEGDPSELAEMARPIGLTDTKYGGANFNNDWTNLKWRSSYFFNTSNTTNQYSNDKLFQLVDTSYRYLQNGSTQQQQTNQRVDASADWKINQRNSIKVSPHIDLTTSENHLTRNFQSLSLNKAILNDGQLANHTKARHTLGSAEILARHRFATPGYSLLLQVKPEWYTFDQTQENASKSTFYNLPSGEQQKEIAQLQMNKSEQKSLSANGVFTMPLSKKTYLQIGDKIYFNRGEYNIQIRDQLKEKIDPQLSDVLQTNQWQNLAKVSFAGQWQKLQLTMDAGYLVNDLRGTSATKDYTIAQKFHAFAPEVLAEYKFDPRRKLRFKYNYTTTLPAMQYLQALPDKSDPLYIRNGNPALKPIRLHAWSVHFRQFDTGTGNSLFAVGDVRYYNSQVTDSTSIDLQSGVQYVMPTNVKGNYSASLTLGKSFRLKNNGSNMNTELQTGYQYQTIFNNGIATISKAFTLRPGMDMNYYFGYKTSVHGKFNATWYNRQLTMASIQPQTSWLLNYSIETIHMLPYRTTFETSFEAYSTLGLSNGYNQTIPLLSLALQKEVGKSFSLRFDAKDVMNKNAGLTRIMGNGFIEDRRNNALGRYFMLSGVYKFRQFKKIKS